MINPFNPEEIARLAPFVPGSTNRESTVYIDEVTCRATATSQWLLENADDGCTHPITAHNVIRLFICGQEGFAAIAADLENARATVDLVCWGFDPGMELVRSAGTWPRGETFGGLLRRIATRAQDPVKVRLLVWYSMAGSIKMKNLPGHTDGIVQRVSNLPPIQHLAQMGQSLPNLPLVEPPTVSERRVLHCVEWWKWALDDRNRHQIEIVKRAGDSDAVKKLIIREHHQPAAERFPSEKMLIEGFSTHHQKTILVDYHHEEGAHAVGYVMGLNSLTGYWDTRAHRFNDPLRERQQDAPPGTAVSAVLEKISKSKGDATDLRVDPLHDYACRIRGQALQCVQRNFHRAWLRAGGSSQNDETQLPTRLVEADRFAQGSRLQVIRTQPEEKDQTVRDLYFHATAQATNYLYIENQYFQYTEWAQHLVESRKSHRDFYQKVAPASGPAAPNILHVLVVIPKPETAEMVPRTYDTLMVLGRSDLMHELDSEGMDAGQWVMMTPERDALREWYTWHPKNVASRREFDLVQREKMEIQKATMFNPNLHKKYGRKPYVSDVGKSVELISEPTMAELEKQGIKVLVAMLESYDDGTSGLKANRHSDKYRQIYIHSKLLMIDDAFFTLGSANLNQRSMAADSEINIATDDPVQTTKLRKEVWGQHTGGLHDGGDGTNASTKETFKNWQKLMRENDLNKIKGSSLTGFLSTFHDSKTSGKRYG